MAVLSKADIIQRLAKATTRTRKVREAAERERQAVQFQETEAQRISQTPLQAAPLLKGKG